MGKKHFSEDKADRRGGRSAGGPGGFGGGAAGRGNERSNDRNDRGGSDRGGFGKSVIDLSEAEAREIDMIDAGTTAVSLYQCR